MRLRLLLPLMMLALAVLACDDVIFYDTVFVAALDGDAEQPGYVRIVVRERAGYAGEVATDPPVSDRDAYYASTDYGRTWAPTEPFDAPEPSLALDWQRESLRHGSTTLWAMPRAGFRDFFYRWTEIDSASTVKYFVPTQGRFHNDSAGDVIYVSLGTEGILVGPAPGSDSTRPWELRQEIPGLRPLPLAFRDPLTVAGVVLAALLLPPLPFIHAYLLSRVWRYLMPAADAWRRALRLSLAFAALAAAAIVAWVVPTTLDIGFHAMALVVGVLVVAVSASMTVRHGRAVGLRRGMVRRAAIMAALVAAVVPLGVLAVWWAWWAVALLVFGYMAMWALANRHLRRNDIVTEPAKPIMHWWTDRLALEGMLITTVPLVLAIMVYFFRPWVQNQTLVVMGICLLTLGLGVGLVQRCFGQRGRVLLAAGGLQEPYQPPRSLDTGIMLMAWWAAAGVASVALWIGQLAVAGWFNSLMAR